MEFGALVLFGILYFTIITGIRFGKKHMLISFIPFMNRVLFFVIPKYIVALVVCAIGYFIDYITLDILLRMMTITTSFFALFVLWAYLAWHADRARPRPRI
ncbi:MAG: hypothetical protein WCW78_01920 [Candidatus Paceibacterota bacterium]